MKIRKRAAISIVIENTGPWSKVFQSTRKKLLSVQICTASKDKFEKKKIK